MDQLSLSHLHVCRFCSHHDRHHHRRHHIVVQYVVQRGNNAVSSSVLGMLAQGFNAWDGAQRHSSFCSSLWERSFKYHCFGYGRTDVIFPPSPHPLPDPNPVVRSWPGTFASGFRGSVFWASSGRKKYGRALTILLGQQGLVVL